MKSIFLTVMSLMLFNIGYAEPLSPDKAYHFIATIKNNSIMIYATIEPQYQLYKNNINIINNKSTVQLGKLIKPSGKRQYNEILNKYQEQYEGDILMEIPILDNIENKKGIIEFDIEAQGCTKTICYSPFITHIKIEKNAKI